MIKINTTKGYLVLGRCGYLYRDAFKVGDELVGRDDVANSEMGDGDILIPLPPYMCNQGYPDDLLALHGLPRLEPLWTPEQITQFEQDWLATATWPPKETAQ